jgi:glycerate-2-kinase
MVSLERMRSDALAAFSAAVFAARPENLVPARIRRSGSRVLIGGEPLPEATGRHVVFAIGKAAPGLAAAWMRELPSWTNELYVLTPHGAPVPEEVDAAAIVLRGAHPYPDADGEASTRHILEVARNLAAEDLLVVLLSGGGSALMAAPEEGLTLDDVSVTTRALLEAGAAINDVNAVRRQLLAAAGGGLARAAYPAPVHTLILSDVLGDPLTDIASGPTTPSRSTAADALAVVNRLALQNRIPQAVVAHLTSRAGTVADDSCWASAAATTILGNNRTAVNAAATELGNRDYGVGIAAEHLVGEARERGAELARAILVAESSGPWAVVCGGETTVTVRGKGRGGRNQELALAAAMELAGAGSTVVLAAGTDGVDGLSENAGAIVDDTTIERLHGAGIEPREALADNDSATALDAIGDTIRTGPTGTNVCDLTIVLTARS